MTSLTPQMNARAIWWYALTVVVLVGADWVSDWPLPAGLIPLIVLGTAFGVRVVGDGFASAYTARALASQQEYVERYQLAAHLEINRNGIATLRASLDESGQHACDLIQDAIDRRDGETP